MQLYLSYSDVIQADKRYLRPSRGGSHEPSFKLISRRPIILKHLCRVVQRYASTRYIDDVATVILINLVLVHIELMPAIVLNTKPNRMLNRGPFR